MPEAHRYNASHFTSLRGRIFGRAPRHGELQPASWSRTLLRDSPNNPIQREEAIREKNIQNKFGNCNLQRLHYADK